MATPTGFDWGNADHMTYTPNGGPADVDGIAVADNGTLTTDELTQDVKASTYLGIISVEDNSGACDGNVTIFILGPDADKDGEGYESPTDDAPSVVGVIDQGQNKTHRRVFSVPGSQYPKFKVHALNEAGQEIALTINYYQSDVPAAEA